MTCLPITSQYLPFHYLSSIHPLVPPLPMHSLPFISHSSLPTTCLPVAPQCLLFPLPISQYLPSHTPMSSMHSPRSLSFLFLFTIHHSLPFHAFPFLTKTLYNKYSLSNFISSYHTLLCTPPFLTPFLSLPPSLQFCPRTYLASNKSPDTHIYFHPFLCPRPLFPPSFLKS